MRFDHGKVDGRAFLGRAEGRLKRKTQVSYNPLRRGVRGGDGGKDAGGMQLQEGVVKDIPQEFPGEEARGCCNGHMRHNGRAEDSFVPYHGSGNSVGQSPDKSPTLHGTP